MAKTIEEMLAGAEKSPAKEQNEVTPVNWKTIDQLKKEGTMVFFATPCYGGNLTDQYFLSMFKVSQLLTGLGIGFSITTLRNESLIPRGRNILSAMFLESNCSHLMFIDADIEFDPDSVVRLLQMDKDLIVGAYPKKTLPIQYAINLRIMDPAKGKLNMDNGAVEVLDASTGFFMVKRRVFEKLIQAHPELLIKNDSAIDSKYHPYLYALFDTMLDPDDGRYLSEDYTFIRRYQKIGGQVWLDPQTKLNHVGSYTFEGNISQLLRKGEK